MSRIISLCLALLACSWSQLSSQTLPQIESKRVELPNGWKLTPVGNLLPLGDLPLNIAVSPSKKLVAVTNNGQSDQMVELIDVPTSKILDTVVMDKSWLGLVFSSDSKSLYASGGNDNFIIRFLIVRNKLVPADTFVFGKPWPVKISIAGIAVDDSRKILYTVTKENNSLYVFDMATRQIKGVFPLGGEGYTCLLSPDRRMLYISCWGCNKVMMFNTDKMQFSGVVAVGDNPNELCLSEKGDLLFVANANDNTVSVISTKERRVIETLNCALFPNAPEGSTTNGLALSEDGKTLYAANADNNCLAVFEISEPGKSRSKGFIPTGWYPTCVRVIGKTILVANGKGLTSKPNPFGPNPAGKNEDVAYQKAGKKVKEQYIGGLFRGTLSILPEPDEAQLSAYSQAVYHNSPYNQTSDYLSEGEEGNPIPMRVGDASPIKYVFYIIKENRTYDQVLGDIPQGNGDPSLVLFGENITPNQHAIAREFVLLDNFYVNGEVSADGHNWSLGAYATDYLEKNWPTNYSDRGGTYDSEGTREIANNKHFIWDICKRYGVSYRTYGEFADDYKANIPVLEGHFCTFFTSWDQRVRDTVRFGQWKRDFDSLLAFNAVPKFNSLRFINDHTEGLSFGRPTPFAHAADNDLAVGMFVDYLSHSKIWNECAIFIVEDDAQNGPDHVDAHRTTAYVAGGFVKDGYVDHTLYSTSSMLRTIELILGIPPMSQYDASATPMWRCFNSTAAHRSFDARPISVDLNDKNMKISEWSKMSDSFNFAKEDRVPDADFNTVIWKAVKGLEAECPAPVHSAFFTAGEIEDED
ncbi:MAG TPA: bifunctional YncE family protein/alkaline phosphatase family protein [Bacteroidales bacterium]|nr:bifunctional YncE family protein/alkaline phosphatase family protein [Bacteroidales bacterium]